MKRTTVSIMILVVGLFLLASSQPQYGDVNCDGEINIMDIVHAINYLYKEGAEPCKLYGPSVAYFRIDHIPQAYYPAEQWGNVAQVAIDVPTSGIVLITANCVEKSYAGEAFNMAIDTIPDGGSITFPNNPNPFDVPLSRYGQDIQEVIPVDPGSYTFYYN